MNATTTKKGINKMEKKDQATMERIIVSLITRSMAKGLSYENAKNCKTVSLSNVHGAYTSDALCHSGSGNSTGGNLPLDARSREVPRGIAE